MTYCQSEDKGFRLLLTDFILLLSTSDVHTDRKSESQFIFCQGLTMVARLYDRRFSVSKED